MEKQVEQLAKEMGVTPADLRGFIDCLRVWMNKGLSLEQAIERHMAHLHRLFENAQTRLTHEERRDLAANLIWDAVNA